jgi:hypothetical protein
MNLDSRSEKIALCYPTMSDPQPTDATGASEPPLQRLLHQAEEYARRDPAKAMATAFGAGLLLNLVPPRVVVGTVTAVAVPFMRPALLALGLFKAFELCCKADRPAHGLDDTAD